jgi:hypothetical protein
MKPLIPLLSVAFAFASVCQAAELQTIAYPTVESASFEISAPDDWKLNPAEEEGEYFDLEGPTGAVFSFRTIAGSESSMSEAIEESLKDLAENYKEPELGEPKDWTPNGLKGFYTSGSAIDKQDDAKVVVGMGWCALTDGKIAEFWFVAEADDAEGIAQAEKIANSLTAP